MSRMLNENMFVDYELFQKEIKRFEAQKKGIIAEINTQNKNLSDIVEKQIAAQKEAEKIISDAKAEAKEIKEKAKDKETQADNRNAELQGELIKTQELQKKASDIIKSGEGREKNIVVEMKAISELKEKLAKVFELIKNVL